MDRSIADLRENYSRASLDESDVNPDPFAQFRKWFSEAIDSQLPEPNAFSLGTISDDDRPRVRTVLMKDFSEAGLVFYTNYGSAKSQDIEAHPFAAATFTWLGLERQVRLEGRAERVSEIESDAYFLSRPRGSQIGAWVSPQSEEISLAELRQLQMENEQRFEHDPLIRPEFWGGWRIIPDYIEFWQGRPNRLHDRIAFRMENNAWRMFRLAP